MILITVAVAALLVSTAPAALALDRAIDRDFDAGSGIEVSTLSET